MSTRFDTSTRLQQHHQRASATIGKAPVLKNKVHSWLVQKKEVLAFVQAKPADGGAGALVVLLQGG